jgi:hypothetical protein
MSHASKHVVLVDSSSPSIQTLATTYFVLFSKVHVHVRSGRVAILILLNPSNW